MKRYEVWMHTVPGVGSAYYDGKVDVYAEDEQQAIERARLEVRRVHGSRPFKVDEVRWKP